MGDSSERVFEGVAPRVSPEAYVAEGAVLVGDVTVGEGSSIWHNAVLRGDREPVRVGRFTSIQDNCTVHVDPGLPAVIGNYVTVGHGAVIHAATVEDDVLVGMNATILSGAVIGRGSVVGAGALVTEGTRIPPGSLVLGLPGKVVRALRSEEIEGNHRHAAGYAELALRHKGSTPR